VRTDYFTRREFLDLAGDNRGEKYTPQMIDRAQHEVVEALEVWALSSWANVADPLAATGTMTAASAVLVASAGAFAAGDVGKPIAVEGAGPDGSDLETTVASFTSATQVTLAAAATTAVAGAVVRRAAGTDGERAAHLGREDRIFGRGPLLLDRVPVISTYLLRTGEVDLAAEVVDLPVGVIRVADWQPPEWPPYAFVRVGYRYGHGEVPWTIKRAAIGAAKELVDLSEGGGRIPENVTRWTTEGATFEVEEPEDEAAPWPWAPSSSRSVRTYWGPRRPRSMGVRL
jgi:hypothetical protein